MIAHPVLMSVLLCLAMLAGAAHLAGRVPPLRDTAWAGGAFVVALALSLWLTISPELIAVIVAGGAIWRLGRGVSTTVALVLGGVMAGLAVCVYEDAGAPLWLATMVVLGVMALAVWVGSSAVADTVRVRDGALLAIAWIAPVIAVLPGIIAGWGSARALNQTLEPLSTGVPLWAGLVPATALLAGGVVGYWKRR